MFGSCSSTGGSREALKRKGKKKGPNLAPSLTTTTFTITFTTSHHQPKTPIFPVGCKAFGDEEGFDNPEILRLKNLQQDFKNDLDLLCEAITARHVDITAAMWRACITFSYRNEKVAVKSSMGKMVPLYQRFREVMDAQVRETHDDIMVVVKGGAPVKGSGRVGW